MGCFDGAELLGGETERLLNKNVLAGGWACRTRDAWLSWRVAITTALQWDRPEPEHRCWPGGQVRPHLSDRYHLKLRGYESEHAFANAGSHGWRSYLPDHTQQRWLDRRTRRISNNRLGRKSDRALMRISGARYWSRMPSEGSAAEQLISIGNLTNGSDG